MMIMTGGDLGIPAIPARLWLVTAGAGIRQGYDTYDSFVVRAWDAHQARFLAAKKVSYDRSPDEEWLTKAYVSEILPDGEPEVILDSFNAG